MKRAVGTAELALPASREENLKALATPLLKTLILLGKPYGQNYVVHVMTAKAETQWRDLSHTLLETYGTVPGYLRNRLVCAIHHLVDIGLIEVNAPSCSTLKITDAGRNWLEKPRDLLTRSACLYFTGLELYLREALRLHRRETSQLTGTQPWFIFTDYSLDRVALGKPLSLEQLCQLPGFTTSKCEQYGPGVVRVVQNVIENYAEYRRQNLVQRAKGRSYQAVLQLFTENHTLPEIAMHTKLKLDTVVKYLCDLHEIARVDMVPWIEQNVNSKALYTAVEYFSRVQGATLREGYVTLGLDYTTLRFGLLYKLEKDAPEKAEAMRLSA